MARTPEELMDGLLRTADAALGDAFSAVLYGSMVRGDFVPGRSDLNLLLIARPLTVERLRALGPALAAFEREGQTPPLLFDETEWHRAADVFPIEITDMRLAYRVLRGADPLAEHLVAPGDLRRALEHEWRGKVLRLRQDFAAHLDLPDSLGQAIARSAGSVRVLLRTTLVLAGRTPPADDTALVEEAAILSGAPASPPRPRVLAAALAHRRDPSWSCSPAAFEGYLTAIEQLTRFVDHFHAGET